MWLLIACLVTSWSLFWPRRHWSLCVRSWPSFGLEHGCTRCVFAVKFYVFFGNQTFTGFLKQFWCTFYAYLFCFLFTFYALFALFYSFFMHFLCISYQLFMHFLCTFYAFFMHFWCTFYALFMPLQKAHKKCIHFLKKCMHFLCTF